MIKFLLSLLVIKDSEKLSLVAPIYKLIGNIVLKEEKFLGKFLDCGLLKSVRMIINGNGVTMRRDSCWLISNMVSS